MLPAPKSLTGYVFFTLFFTCSLDLNLELEKKSRMSLSSSNLDSLGIVLNKMSQIFPVKANEVIKYLYVDLLLI